METQIKSFKEIKKPGQLFLIDNPIMKDDVVAFFGKLETYKYPIGDDKGNRCRSLGMVDGKLKFVNAKDENAVGDEMINEYTFVSENVGGNYTFLEDDDPTAWNIRIIDKKHPKYNKLLCDEGKMFAQQMKGIELLFNHEK